MLVPGSIVVWVSMVLAVGVVRVLAFWTSCVLCYWCLLNRSYQIASTWMVWAAGDPALACLTMET